MAAADEFHRLMDAGHFESLYAASTPAFKARNSSEQFVDLLSRVHTKMGACKPAKLTKGLFRSTNRGSFGFYSYSRKCESGDLYEDFQWQIVDGNILLHSYSPKSSF